MMKSFLITAAIFFGICLAYILMMLSVTENYFTYILDDAYIHLAVAKNFALHGVWGVTKYAFSSSSSSPVFTFILSILISVFGNHALIPLVFNIIVCGLLIIILTRYYSNFLHPAKHVVGACLFTLFISVLHVQVMSGMEHVLQVFVVAVNIYCFQHWIKGNFKMNLHAYWFYFTVLLLGLIRFESMFYFLSLAFVFLLVRNFKNAVLVLLFGFIPIVVFGYFNYHRSGYFFPNSVVVKGTLIDFSGNVLTQITDIILKKLLLNITFYKIGLFPLLIGGALMYKDYKSKPDFRSVISGNFLFIALGLTLIMHCLFGEIRSIFRYEAYLLIAFSMVLIPRLLSYFIKPWSAFKTGPIIGIFIIANALLLIYKCNYSHALILNGSANIYEQQIQSARFLNRYYNTSKVVANDIGAITYFTEIHLLDFVGLGSMELVDFKIRKKTFDDDTEEFLSNYTRDQNYQLAIAYEEWLDGHTPQNWKKVAALEVKSDNAVLGFKRLFIYSIDPQTRNALIQNIKDFHWNKDVTVTMIK
ncbi:hypothetical protein EDF65_3482 [Chryseobacterium nakagawai]|nr:hypothetical protein EDF65_3482 [Chryseobacterium nakagawai]